MHFSLCELANGHRPLAELFDEAQMAAGLSEKDFSQAVRSLCDNPCCPDTGQRLWRILVDGRVDHDGHPNGSAIADLLVKQHDIVAGLRQAFFSSQAA